MSWECGVSLEKISSMSSVDHIDRNGLNNQISNLRLVTQSENCQNREFPKKSNGYIGVNGCKNGYVAQVGLNGKKLYVGTFDNEIDAAEKRDIAVLKIYGNTAKLNFPTKRSEYQKMLDDGFDPLPRRDFVPYSEYSGVTFRKDLDRWQAYISIGQQKELNLDGDHRIVVGIYSTEQEAIGAHKKALDDLVQGKEILTPYQEQCKFKYYGIQLNPSGKYQSKINYNGENHSS